VTIPATGGTGLPRALIVLLGGAAAVVVAFGMRELGWLIGPAFLAVVIVVLVHPVHHWLRRRVPAALALLGLLIAIFGVVVALASVLAFSVIRLAAILPDYSRSAATLVEVAAAQLQQWGIDQDYIQGFLRNIDIERVAGWLTALSNSVLNFGGYVVFVLTLLLFMGIDSTSASTRMNVLAATRPDTAKALRDFAHRTRKFLGVTTLFGVIIGVVDTVVLEILGIPFAPLWGMLAVVCTYIPYVGFAIALIPPALLALLGADWQMMVVVVIVYVVVNSLFPSLVPPYFVGDAVGLSVPFTLLAVVFWTWVLGPIGSVLGLPMTLLVKAVLVDADPRAAWARSFLDSSSGPREPSDKKAKRTRGRAAEPPTS
jgi:AI-2 transport protein TqsA